MIRIEADKYEVLRAVQVEMEKKYDTKRKKEYIAKDLEGSADIGKLISECREVIINWAKEDHYDSKKEMLEHLLNIEEESNNTYIENMLMEIMCEVLLGDNRQDLTAVVGRGLHALPWKEEDAYDTKALKRMGEILTHMCDVGLFDIVMPSGSAKGVLTIEHNWALEEDTIDKLTFAKFLPPMIAKPRRIRSLRESPYHVAKVKSMSKWWNQKHNGDLRLDYLNKRNAVAFKLDLEYLKVCEDVKDFAQTAEEMTNKLGEKGAITGLERLMENWEKFQTNTNKIAVDLYNSSIAAGGDGEIYFSNFYCNRGRTYCKGYHISYQGNSHRKAMLNFADTSTVGGVDEYAEFF